MGIFGSIKSGFSNTKNLFEDVGGFISGAINSGYDYTTNPRSYAPVYDWTKDDALPGLVKGLDVFNNYSQSVRRNTVDPFLGFALGFNQIEQQTGPNGQVYRDITGSRSAKQSLMDMAGSWKDLFTQDPRTTFQESKSAFQEGLKDPNANPWLTKSQKLGTDPLLYFGTGAASKLAGKGAAILPEATRGSKGFLAASKAARIGSDLTLGFENPATALGFAAGQVGGEYAASKTDNPWIKTLLPLATSIAGAKTGSVAGRKAGIRDFSHIQSVKDLNDEDVKSMIWSDPQSATTQVRIIAGDGSTMMMWKDEEGKFVKYVAAAGGTLVRESEDVGTRAFGVAPSRDVELKKAAKGRKAMQKQLKTWANTGEIDPIQADLANSMLDALPDKYLKDLSFSTEDLKSYQAHNRALGTYNAADSIIRISRELMDMQKKNLGPEFMAAYGDRIIAHEIAHHLTKFVPQDDLEKLFDDYVADYMDNAGEARRLFEEYERGAGQLTAGQAAALTGNYRYKNFMEWIAENISEKFQVSYYDKRFNPKTQSIFLHAGNIVRNVGVGVYNWLAKNGKSDHLNAVYDKMIAGKYNHKIDNYANAKALSGRADDYFGQMAGNPEFEAEMNRLRRLTMSPDPDIAARAEAEMQRLGEQESRASVQGYDKGLGNTPLSKLSDEEIIDMIRESDRGGRDSGRNNIDSAFKMANDTLTKTMERLGLQDKYSYGQILDLRDIARMSKSYEGFLRDVPLSPGRIGTEIRNKFDPKDFPEEVYNELKQQSDAVDKLFNAGADADIEALKRGMYDQAHISGGSVYLLPTKFSHSYHIFFNEQDSADLAQKLGLKPNGAIKSLTPEEARMAGEAYIRSNGRKYPSVLNRGIKNDTLRRFGRNPYDNVKNTSEDLASNPEFEQRMAALRRKTMSSDPVEAKAAEAELERLARGESESLARGTFDKNLGNTPVVKLPRDELMDMAHSIDYADSQMALERSTLISLRDELGLTDLQLDHAKSTILSGYDKSYEDFLAKTSRLARDVTEDQFNRIKQYVTDRKVAGNAVNEAAWELGLRGTYDRVVFDDRNREWAFFATDIIPEKIAQEMADNPIRQSPMGQETLIGFEVHVNDLEQILPGFPGLRQTGLHNGYSKIDITKDEAIEAYKNHMFANTNEHVYVSDETKRRFNNYIDKRELLSKHGRDALPPTGMTGMTDQETRDRFQAANQLYDTEGHTSFQGGSIGRDEEAASFINTTPNNAPYHPTKNPMGMITPRQFLLDLPSIAEEEAKVKTYKNAAIRALVGTAIAPDVLKDTPVGRFVVAHRRLTDTASQAADVIVSATVGRYAGRTGIRDIFGEHGSVFAIDKKGISKEFGVFWSTVFANPTKYNLSATQRQLIDSYNKAIEEVGILKQMNGVDTPFPYIQPDGSLYVPRVVEEINGVKMPTRTNHSKDRIYRKPEQGIKKGIGYATDPRDVLKQYIKEGYQDVIDKQFADSMHKFSVNVDELIPQRIKDAYNVAEANLNAFKPTVKAAHAAWSANQADPALKAAFDQAVIDYNVMSNKFMRAKIAIDTTRKNAKSSAYRTTNLFGYQGQPIKPLDWTSRFFPSVSGTKKRYFHPDDWKTLNDTFGMGGYLKPNSAEQSNLIAKTFRVIGDTTRFVGASMDFAFGLTHGLPLLGYRPDIWAKAMGNQFKGFLLPGTRDKYIARNFNDVFEMVAHGVDPADHEFFNAIHGGGILPGTGKIAARGLDFVGLGNPARSIGKKATQQTFGRFESALNSALITARTELWKSGKSSYADPYELGSFINKITGGLSSKRLGVSRSQRDWESTWLAFSPRLLRSTVALTGTALRVDTKQGREAAKALAGLATASVAFFTAVGFAMHRDEFEKDPWGAWNRYIAPNLNPLNGKQFLAYNINGQWYGVGGQVRAITQLTANLVSAHPEDLGSMDMNQNPIMQWYAARGAPGVNLALSLGEAITGEDINKYEQINGPMDFAQSVGYNSIPFTITGALEGNSMGATIASSMGTRTSPATDWDTLNLKADEMFGKDYNSLNNEQKQILKSRYPVSIDKDDPLTQYFAQVDTVNQEFAKEVALKSALVQMGKMSKVEFKAWYSDQLRQKAARIDMTKRDFQYVPIERPGFKGSVTQYLGDKTQQPEDAAVSEWYSLPDQAIKDNGQLDFEKLQELRSNFLSGLDADVRAYVIRNTVKEGSSDPVVGEMERAKDYVGPYFDMEKQVFEEFKKASPFFAKFKDLDAYNRSIEEMSKSLGLSFQTTEALMEKKVRDIKVYNDMMSKLRKTVRVLDPQLDSALTDWYGFEPANRLDDILSAHGLTDTNNATGQLILSNPDTYGGSKYAQQLALSLFASDGPAQNSGYRPLSFNRPALLQQENRTFRRPVFSVDNNNS